jgi:hypothetical protein
LRKGLVVISVAVLAALGGVGADSAISRPASTTRITSINTTLTVQPGRAATLYSVHGFHYGAVGRFATACTDSGLARVTYVLDRLSPDALVAVDGRGAARGAKLAPPRRSLPGGGKPSGIEHWIVLTGGEPETIELDASLFVISAKSGLGYCDFLLRGTLKVKPH